MTTGTGSSRRIEVFKIILIWVAQWLTIVGGTIYLLAPVGADQLNRFYLTCAYFLTFAGYGAWYYKIHQVFPHHISLKKQVVPILYLVLATFVFCIAVDFLFPISEITRQAILAQRFYFPLFEYPTVAAKVCDITYQQVFVYGLVKSLKKTGLSDSNTLKLFLLSFFSIHLPLFFSFKLFAVVFIVPSFFAGALFSYLILKYRLGFFKSYALHVSFYLTVGIFFRYFYFT